MSNFLLIREIEASELKQEAIPEVHVGDTVVVSTTIIEGKKKRTQRYEGVVVKIQGDKNRHAFTVRRVIDRIGVEKSFLFHSPLVSEVKVTKRGKVRRARLNYLRERIGVRANRVKTKEKVSSTKNA